MTANAMTMTAALRISVDAADIDIDVVHDFLSKDSYWCRGVPRPVVEAAIANSLCFSALLDGKFVGFSRVVSDRATFAYLCDVFVLPDARGVGVGKAMLRAIDAHPDLQGLRRFLLATADAHGLYAQHDFAPLSRPERFMERYRPDVYQR
ncbi:MAG TPA: GNAT family N-acetyltransferase [Arenimonas sp.]|uniref:GNAT family N-acetyltransferase n=1 Tax=Arenimonas sp. TaxID=1872635 RepID=UPI002D1C0E60|nr:GNAT family N-acetyltransferase [Arenimonas sp.]HMB56269.1 GNAT family N-acetyltransferase [Arenimonas sp.]